MHSLCAGAVPLHSQSRLQGPSDYPLPPHWATYPMAKYAQVLCAPAATKTRPTRSSTVSVVGMGPAGTVRRSDPVAVSTMFRSAVEAVSGRVARTKARPFAMSTATSNGDGPRSRSSGCPGSPPRIAMPPPRSTRPRDSIRLRTRARGLGDEPDLLIGCCASMADIMATSRHASTSDGQTVRRTGIGPAPRASRLRSADQSSHRPCESPCHRRCRR